MCVSLYNTISLLRVKENDKTDISYNKWSSKPSSHYDMVGDTSTLHMITQNGDSATLLMITQIYGQLNPSLVSSFIE